MARINKILCPIDFSDFSRHAFDRAVGIARGTGASVTAVHVATSQTTPLSTHIEARAADAFVLSHADLMALKGELSRFLDVDAVNGVSVTCKVVRAPHVAAKLVAQAQRLPADLIVMGTHGRSGFKRLVFGSVAERVLRTAMAPVLTVGAKDQTAADSGLAFKRILCAVDFSDCSLAAWDYALSLARGADAKLALVHVVGDLPVGCDPLMGPAVDLAGYQLAAETFGRERLQDLVTAAAAKAVVVEQLVVSGQPHHEILRQAAAWDCDLIVLGIHGKNPIDRLIFGATAEPVVRRATCPVLTVRAGVRAKSAAA